MEEAGTELARLGHLILDGTPAADVDPAELIPYGQCDATAVDACRAAPEAVAV